MCGEDDVKAESKGGMKRRPLARERWSSDAAARSPRVFMTGGQGMAAERGESRAAGVHTAAVRMTGGPGGSEARQEGTRALGIDDRPAIPARRQKEPPGAERVSCRMPGKPPARSSNNP